MSNLSFGSSPFDGIRKTDEYGQDYWLARELMVLLGYSTWQKFEDALNRAQTTCKNMGNNPSDHFLPKAVKSTGGRPAADFRLSKYGCHLTAMNGDPRKPEIAAAQTYFSVKTHEAESSQLVDPIVLLLEQARDNRLRQLELERRQLEHSDKLAQQEQLLNEHEAELDRLHSPDGHYFTVLGYGNLLGFKLSRKEAQVLGGAASRHCRKHGIRKETVYDSSFGTIGNYPQEVLQVVFKDAGYIAKGGAA